MKLASLRGIDLLPQWLFDFAKAASTAANFNRCYGVYTSLRHARPTNAAGEIVPWYTYPAIEYLSSFDFSERTLFEYGSGYSTMYWSKRCRRVVAVEHDPTWHKEICRGVSPNTKVVLAKERLEYVGAIERDRELFDIVVIDGMWRVECLEPSVHHLKENGIIILDNADWYPTVTERCRAIGFSEIDFSGFAPLNRFTTTTAIFFRSLARLQKDFRGPRPRGGRSGGELANA
jgi:hypothetical protein